MMIGHGNLADFNQKNKKLTSLFFMLLVGVEDQLPLNLHNLICFFGDFILQLSFGEKKRCHNHLLEKKKKFDTGTAWPICGIWSVDHSEIR